MSDVFDDPAGVFDEYSDEQLDKLTDAMYEDPLDVETEWVETDNGKRLKMICPECDVDHFQETRPSTLRCDSCMRIMQAADYNVDPHNPDPENPDWYLEAIARQRGEYPDEYKKEPEPESALSW